MQEWTRRALRKQERRLTKPARLEKWKRIVAEERDKGELTSFRLQWYILQMWKREGFSVSEMADILSFTESEVRFEMDIAIQNGR